MDAVPAGPVSGMIFAQPRVSRLWTPRSSKHAYSTNRVSKRSFGEPKPTRSSFRPRPLKLSVKLFESANPSRLRPCHGKNSPSVGIEPHNRARFRRRGPGISASPGTQDRLAPGSLAVASTLVSLTLNSLFLGSLDAGERYGRRAQAIFETVDPQSRGLVALLGLEGGLLAERGDLRAAEAMHRRSMALAERRAPGEMFTAFALENLGELARERGDLASAEGLYRRSLAIKQRFRAPDNDNLSDSFDELGRLAQDRGDLTAAEDLFLHALAIREKINSNSVKSGNEPYSPWGSGACSRRHRLSESSVRAKPHDCREARSRHFGRRRGDEQHRPRAGRCRGPRSRRGLFAAGACHQGTTGARQSHRG